MGACWGETDDPSRSIRPDRPPEQSHHLWRRRFLDGEPESGRERSGLLREHGVNHIDVAASYGEAEDHIGVWMDRHRDDFFLATKTGERGYDGAKAELRRSLDRLRVESVDAPTA